MPTTLNLEPWIPPPPLLSWVVADEEQDLLGYSLSFIINSALDIFLLIDATESSSEVSELITLSDWWLSITREKENPSCTVPEPFMNPSVR